MTLSGFRGAIEFKLGGFFTLDTVTIENCIRRYDSEDGSGSGYGAAIRGGGASTYESATFILRNCILRNNEANHGGAMYITSNTTLDMTNCTLSGNKASSGGAMCISSITATLTGCTFSGNDAPFTTGGSGGHNIKFGYSDMTLSGCIIDGIEINATESMTVEEGRY